ncbi:MAG: PEP-CTERM sorting domain-containing protein [Janthinobacterium sp.]
MHVLKKAGISLALSLSLISLAQADATLTIGSSGSNQYAWLNSGSFEIGRVTFEYGTQSITALQTSVTLKDQGWGGQDPSNGVYVQLLSNNNAVYGFNVAGATHDWQTLNFNLAANPGIYSGLNLALAGIDRANGPISLQFVTNAWGYPGWELHTLNNSLSVTTSLQAVPEPETYAMLLLGLGAIGWVSRRKTRATA